MIYLYTGTPGSGKSLNVARLIHDRLRYASNKNGFLKGKNVIANFIIFTDKVKGENGKNFNFKYINNLDLNPKKLVEIAKKNFINGQENQCLLVIDECHILFNSRDWQKNQNRMEWVSFFTQHRKLGYEIVLVTQFDRSLDRQIRNIVEYQVIHRKLNNYKFFRLLPTSTFIAITVWYGLNEKLSVNYFIYKKFYATFYDSYSMFEIPEDSQQNLGV